MAVKTATALKAQMPIGIIGGTEVQDIHDIVDSIPTVASDDTAYNATTWDADLEPATKNAIRDKIVLMDTATLSNTTHSSSDGTDHTYVDQDIRTTANPTFAGVNPTTTNDDLGTTLLRWDIFARDINHTGSFGVFGTTPTTQQAALTAADGSVVDTTYGTEESNVIQNLVIRVAELESKLQAYGLLA